jgi:hypothetical protein
VAPVVAERWIEHLLRQKWDKLLAAPAIAVRLARLTGDRSRDLSVRVRKDVERKLVAVGAKDDLLRAVREHVPLEDTDRAELFGEALPLGLKWSE